MRRVARRNSPVARAAVGSLVALAVAGATYVTGPQGGAGAQSVLGPSSFQLMWAQGPFTSDQNAPIAESSPIVATLDGAGPSVVVGDRSGYLYAFHVSDGSPVAGWPVQTGSPIDSTPSVAGSGPGGAPQVYLGTGNAFQPDVGGYQAYSAAGRRVWATQVADPPTDPTPGVGVQASMTVTRLQGQTAVFAGALGQESDALSASTGRSLHSWPFFTADSTFSTAAAADLYGTGQTELVVGGASTAGSAFDQTYPRGGHLRVLNAEGGLVCHFDTDQEVDSSPAVGAFLPGRATGIVVGTGQFWSGAADTDTLQAFDSHCGRVWRDRLDGVTSSSPALAEVEGDGSLQVVEGTDLGSGGSVWVVDAATGRPIWQKAVSGRVIGSVVTADLSGAGYQDLIVPTTFGTDILDGRTGATIDVLSQAGYQNAPLVTDDPDGNVGITIAGYDGNNEGVVYHYEIPGSNGAAAVGSSSWPMFHHDPQLTGVSGAIASVRQAACQVPAAARTGYDTVASDGGVFSFGPPFCGSTGGVRLARPVVAAAESPGVGGYWMAASDGGVFAFGGASFHGSTGNVPLSAPVVAIAASPDGHGYWLAAADGGIFGFGDATFHGSAARIRLVAPVVGMAATVDGRGYWLVTADGGVFSYGTAVFQGSAGGLHLAHPIVGAAEDRATGGYWLVGSDGGVFSFGAPFLGSTGGVHLRSPIVGIMPTEDGHGYWLVAADGGVFSFGDAGFHGSTGSVALARPVVGLVGMAG